MFVEFKTRARNPYGTVESVYVQREHVHYVARENDDRIKGNTVINMGALSNLTVEETVEEVMAKLRWGA